MPGQDRHRIRELVRAALKPIEVSGKMGESVLKRTVADVLRGAGFTPDVEDKAQLLREGMPVWRTKDSGLIEETRGRRRIDIAVYHGDELAGLIETESDLDDLRENGVSTRSGHYDVFSIAQSREGSH